MFPVITASAKPDYTYKISLSFNANNVTLQKLCTLSVCLSVCLSLSNSLSLSLSLSLLSALYNIYLLTYIYLSSKYSIRQHCNL